jgi:hypothetical protein
VNRTEELLWTIKSAQPFRCTYLQQTPSVFSTKSNAIPVIGHRIERRRGTHIV